MVKKIKIEKGKAYGILLQELPTLFVYLPLQGPSGLGLITLESLILGLV